MRLCILLFFLIIHLSAFGQQDSARINCFIAFKGFEACDSIDVSTINYKVVIAASETSVRIYKFRLTYDAIEDVEIYEGSGRWIPESDLHKIRIRAGALLSIESLDARDIWKSG